VQKSLFLAESLFYIFLWLGKTGRCVEENKDRKTREKQEGTEIGETKVGEAVRKSEFDER
jgi:hypothetical protein